MPDRIHLTVATIVVDNDRYLMVRETSDGRQVINQPAGHVEPGEDIREAALRETYEETGWRVELEKFVGIYTYRAPANGVTYYRVCFTARPIEEDKQATLDSDIDSCHWLSYEEVLCEQGNLRSQLVLDCIEDFRAGALYPLELLREPV